MGQLVLKDNAASTLAVSLTATAGTGQTVTIAGAGSKFPTVAGTDWSYLTVFDGAGNIETMKVTAHSAGAASFTVSRGTAAGITGVTDADVKAWSAGTSTGVACRLVAQVVLDINGAATSAAASAASAASSAASVSDHIAAATAAHAASAISYAGSTNLVATNVEAALDELDVEKQPINTALSAIANGSLGAFSSRNRIINGGCQIAQYGAVAITNGALVRGGCDRILVFVSATTAAGTVQRGGASGNTALSTTGYLQGVVATTTGSTVVQFSQRIEASNAADLNGKTVTISCKALHNIGTSAQLYITVNKANSPDDFSSTTLLSASSGTSIPSGLSGSTPVAYTTSFGSSDATNGLEIIYYYIGLPELTAKEFYIGDLQLELGSIVTPFERLSIGHDMALCQRYYERGVHATGGYAAGAGGQAIGYIQFKATKRAIPTTYIDASFQNSGLSGIATDNANVFGVRSVITAALSGPFFAVGHWIASSEL